MRKPQEIERENGVRKLDNCCTLEKVGHSWQVRDPYGNVIGYEARLTDATWLTAEAGY